MYYINNEDNWFAKASYSVLPRCGEMTERDRQIAIKIMVNKVLISKENIRYYGNLGYLNSRVQGTLGKNEKYKNYENIIQAFLCAAT